MNDITKEWIDKAEKDYWVAKREFTEHAVYEAVCFHAQQCVEKYLKAILQENNIYFEKIHDLVVLSKKYEPFIPELKDYLDELMKLSAFAVEIRYSGISADKEDAEFCLSLTEKIREIIRKYFGLMEE